MLRKSKVAEASVHDTKLSQRQLIFEAPRMSPGRANARCPAVVEPEGLKQTTDEVRSSQHLSDHKRRHGRMRGDDFFRTPACLVAHRAHALRSELDEHGVRKMGQAWLVPVGHGSLAGLPRADGRANSGVTSARTLSET